MRRLQQRVSPGDTVRSPGESPRETDQFPLAPAEPDGRSGADRLRRTPHRAARGLESVAATLRSTDRAVRGLRGLGRGTCDRRTLELLVVWEVRSVDARSAWGFSSGVERILKGTRRACNRYELMTRDGDPNGDNMVSADRTVASTAGGGSSVTGTSGSADSRPEFSTVLLRQKD